MDEFLYLWPIYGSALGPIAQDPSPRLTGFLKDGRNLAVIAGRHGNAKAALVDSLRYCAKLSYDRLTSASAVTTATDGWLVVDVPVPNRVQPQQLLHRMIRRLYFSAVLHGMGEVAEFRETVQILRLAFLQTRGSVSQGQDTERLDKTGFEFGGTLKAAPEIGIKLTAGDEVKVVDKLTAEMGRFDLLEAEDELTYDLTILQRLEMFADQHARAIGGSKPLQRWERIRSWFKTSYANLRTDQGIRLRTAFVFEAPSITSVLGLAGFFAQAAGLARAQASQILLVGGRELATAIKVDQELGGPVFRNRFQVHPVDAVSGTISTQQKALLKDTVAKPEKGWPPEVLALARRMQELLS